MKNGIEKIAILLTLGFLLVGFVRLPAVAGQESSDDALMKKYAPICGDYEFDLTEYGQDTQTLSFYVKEGKIWVDSGDGDPAAMETLDEAEHKFKAVGSDGQEFEITFVKDDQGDFTICRIVIVAMSIEITGKKIK